jgi:hypothetical protein
MPGFETEGVLTIGRADNPTARRHTLTSFNSSTASSNYIRFNVHNGSTLTNLTNVLTLRGDNRVGIRTTAPTLPLHVEGNGVIGADGEELRIGYVGHDDWAGIAHEDRATVGNFALMQNSNGRTVLNAPAGQLIGFRISNTEYAVLDSTGNFGIGTSSPTQKLDVRGDVFLGTMPGHQTEGTLIIGRDDDPEIRYHTLTSFNSGTDSSNYVRFGVHNGITSDSVTNVLTLRGDNRVGIGTTAPAYSLDVVGDINASANVRAGGVILTSDKRLKSDIVEIDNAMATVSKLNPVHYSKKESLSSQEYDKTEFGFIAQEIKEILPELVTEGKDKDKLLALDYNSLISILTKAIQEQQEEIKDLKGKNQDLQSSLSDINNQILFIKSVLEANSIDIKTVE